MVFCDMYLYPFRHGRERDRECGDGGQYRSAPLYVVTYLLRVRARTCSGRLNIEWLSVDPFISVLASPSSLPRFWMFMYRVSPLTYLIGAMLSTTLANNEVVCFTSELSIINPLNGQTCGEFLAQYMSTFGGGVVNADATQRCQFCALADTNTFLGAIGIRYDNGWRDLGLVWVFIVVNVCGAFLFFRLLRVSKGSNGSTT